MGPEQTAVRRAIWVGFALCAFRPAADGHITKYIHTINTKWPTRVDVSLNKKWNKKKKQKKNKKKNKQQ